MTTRTTLFECIVNQLGEGCCTVVVYSLNPGGCDQPGLSAILY